MKGSVEGQLPSSDRVLVTLGMEKPRECIPLAPLDGPVPDLRHSSVIAEGALVGGFKIHVVWFDSHRQLIYRITYGLVEIGQFFSINPPVERSADIGTVESKVEDILFVGHRILDVCEFGADRRGRGRNIPLSLRGER